MKHCTASQIFKRLNSYSRQHPVYRAIKEYGKIIKTIYILRYINSVGLRQEIQKQLNIVELSNRFSSAITVANAGEMIFLNHRDQLIADACKNLIKSAITCWNYLYITRYIQKLKTEKEKQEFIAALKQGTVIAWRHIYFNGLYDFSEEKLTDSFDLLFSQNYDLFDRWVLGRPKHIVKLYTVRDRAVLSWGINTVCYTMTKLEHAEHIRYIGNIPSTDVLIK